MRLIEAEADLGDVDAFLDRLGAIGDDHGVTVQAFDARYVVDRAHLERAVELADRAIAREEAIARDRAVEILCYAAGRRQIERAVEMGVTAGEAPVVVLVDTAPGGDGHGDGGDGTGEGGEAAPRTERAAVEEIGSMPELTVTATLGADDPGRVREFFDVGEAELAATDATLADLVRERVALLVVEK